MATTAVQTPTTGKPLRWRIGAVIALHLLLGVPAMVPLVFVILCLQYWPLASLGIVQRGSDDWDGAPLVLLVLVPCAFAVWLLIAFASRRYIWPRGTRGFWRASSLAVVFPTVVFVAVPIVIWACRSMT